MWYYMVKRPFAFDYHRIWPYIYQQLLPETNVIAYSVLGGKTQIFSLS